MDIQAFKLLKKPEGKGLVPTFDKISPIVDPLTCSDDLAVLLSLWMLSTRQIWRIMARPFCNEYGADGFMSGTGLGQIPGSIAKASQNEAVE